MAANLDVGELSRVFILPAGVPADVLGYWQEQFNKIMVDPDFIEKLTIAGYGQAYGFGTSEELLAIVRRVKGLDGPTRDLMLELSGVDKLVVK